ncbi:hypothetical protein PHISP_08792, partial [Aspergillus sp. HF37]
DRRHCDRAAADPCLRQRPLSGREGPVELLGLFDPVVLRASYALSEDGPDPRGQGGDPQVPQGRDRGHPGRGLQPHLRR